MGRGLNVSKTRAALPRIRTPQVCLHGRAVESDPFPTETQKIHILTGGVAVCFAIVIRYYNNY